MAWEMEECAKEIAYLAQNLGGDLHLKIQQVQSTVTSEGLIRKIKFRVPHSIHWLVIIILHTILFKIAKPGGFTPRLGHLLIMVNNGQ